MQFSAIGLKKKKIFKEIQTESLAYISFWEGANESFLIPSFPPDGL